jgi:lauroyl/myristoyl acyltransferase
MAFWYVVAFRVAAILPCWLKRVVAQVIALGYFVFNTQQRRGVIANLRVMRPQADHRMLVGLAVKTFEQAGRNLVDFFGLPSMSDEHVRSLVTNFGDLQTILGQKTHGDPFCLVAGHYGHWELAGAVIGLAGYKTHAIALTQNSPVVQRLYESLRVRFGLTTHDIRFGLRHLLRDLPQGEVPAIVSDREYGTGGEEVQFFGHTASFPKGAAVLSCRHHLVGLPAFLVRQSDGRYVLKFGDPIRPEQSDEKGWVKAFVEGFAHQYEGIVDEDPTQFLNFYDFWGGVA